MTELLRIRKPKRYSLLNQSQSNCRTRQLSQPHLLSGNIIQKKKEVITAFINRNYYSPQRLKPNFSNSLIAFDQLNSKLYTMKKYYNYLLNENKQTLISIESEKEKNEKMIMKEIELKDSKNFSINSYEKISVLNPLESVDEIRYRIEKLESDLYEVKSKYKSVEEYTSTITHLIEKEKWQLKNIDDEIVVQENKMKEIMKANRVLDMNIEQKNKIQISSKKYLMTIDDELEKVNKMMTHQELKKKKLQTITQKKNDYYVQLKTNYYTTTLNTREQLALIKSNQMDELRSIEEYQCKRAKKEKKYTSLILGMLIIQKYFLDNANPYSIDAQALKSSKEYTLLFSDHYIIKKNSTETKQSIQTIQTKESKESQKTRKSMINLEESIHQFNALNLNIKQLKTYYRQLLTNEQFTRKKMMDLNEKVLSLSYLKDAYTAKVNEIISKDYKNFKNLIKGNSRFKHFVRSNNKRCQTAKQALKKQNEKTYHLISSLLEDECKQHPDQKEIRQNKNKFIVKSHQCINSIKDAFDSLVLYFKDCSFFNDIDPASLSPSLSKMIMFPIKQNIISNIDCFINKHHEISRKQYVMRLLTYAHKKMNDEDAKFILNVLSHSENNPKQFLNSDLLLEIDIFNFYSNVKAMKNIINTSESILMHYSTNVLTSNKSQPQLVKPQQNLSAQEQAIVKNQGGVDDDASSTYNSKKKIKEKDSQNNTKDFSSSGYPLDNSNKNEKDNDGKNDSFNEIEVISSKRPVTSKITLSNSIIVKLYEPAMKKTRYIRQINEGLELIKQDTNFKRRYEFNINKKRKNFNQLKHELYPYNNPSNYIYITLYRNKC